MTPAHESPELSPEAERLLDDLRRSAGAQIAAWRRYLTAIEKQPQTSGDNDIRGSRPATRPPPV